MKIKKYLLCFLLILTSMLVMACGKNGADSDGTNDGTLKTYTVQLKTVYGKAMSGTEIRIYTDATKSNIVAGGRLNENGEFSFKSADATGCVIFLEGDFTGLAVEESYTVSGETTQIVLKTELLTTIEDGKVFKLGDVMVDVLITTPDGEEYLISELLKTKPVVVLNFWYLNCMPCKMEFPYLQEAYLEYESVVEVLAINPYDGNDENISAFQSETGYTFPMTWVEPTWEQTFNVKSYPTTIVIDRYGIISFVHAGSVTDKETFVKIFEFFASEDYEHTIIERLSDLD